MLKRKLKLMGSYYKKVKISPNALKAELKNRGMTFERLGERFEVPISRSGITKRNNRGWSVAAYFELLDILGFTEEEGNTFFNAEFL